MWKPELQMVRAGNATSVTGLAVFFRVVTTLASSCTQVFKRIGSLNKKPALLSTVSRCSSWVRWKGQGRQQLRAAKGNGRSSWVLCQRYKVSRGSRYGQHTPEQSGSMVSFLFLPSSFPIATVSGLHRVAFIESAWSNWCPFVCNVVRWVLLEKSAHIGAQKNGTLAARKN